MGDFKTKRGGLSCKKFIPSSGRQRKRQKYAIFEKFFPFTIYP